LHGCTRNDSFVSQSTQDAVFTAARNIAWCTLLEHSQHVSQRLFPLRLLLLKSSYRIRLLIEYRKNELDMIVGLPAAC